ncbi:MAG: hypothetical protein K9G43_00670 [Rhodobacteraceae bacterium]|nr:hypothetical protein [Paracoccaceae bacterium]
MIFLSVKVSSSLGFVRDLQEKFACNTFEKIIKPAAPFYPIPRAWAGPNFLAMIVYTKYGQHQPQNLQAER